VNNNTSIFIDSSDLKEISTAQKLLNESNLVLAGCTTNPSLFAKTLGLSSFDDNNQLWQAYYNRIEQIAKLIPQTSISLEVFVDMSSTTHQIIEQLKVLDQLRAKLQLQYGCTLMIKIPICNHTVLAIIEGIKRGYDLNITLGFDYNQGYRVLEFSKFLDDNQQLYFSLFIGRNFDQGINGIYVLKELMEYQKSSSSKTKLLACSFRSLAQLLGALAYQVDIVTIPFGVLQDWAKHSFIIPSINNLNFEGSKPEFDVDSIEPNKLDNIQTIKGINKFASDWNSLIKP
jgi:transaldolase